MGLHWLTGRGRGFRCGVCDAEIDGLGSGIGVCARCLIHEWGRARPLVDAVHRKSRTRFHLPQEAPKARIGAECSLCHHRCRMQAGETGYCGIRTGDMESLRLDGRLRALVSYYHDPIPTNCVADWVCAGGTGVGYPRFSMTKGPEVGWYNLAVFFEACNFNCLYCQNWTFKRTAVHEKPWLAVDEMLPAVTDRTSCICFFGGDPVPQLPFALRFSREAIKNRSGGVLRVCWETNGSMHSSWLRPMVQLSLESGGCIKVDLKAWDPHIHWALCGSDNRQVLENFAQLARWFSMRPDPPLLIASTLLVPGYVGEAEVSRIARFIAELHPDIPYALLGFAPQFVLNDFPTTSRAEAEACLEAARRAGLRRVRLANRHLLC